jgi:hypothetical protein
MIVDSVSDFVVGVGAVNGRNVATVLANQTSSTRFSEDTARPIKLGKND